MNRHHPYGGAPYDAPPRRGGPPGNFGPGPDRSHRFDRGGVPRGRGFGRGRGGGQASYGGYGNAGPYDQGPPQGDMGGYNDYESSPPPGQYYQNGNYNAPGPGQYPDPSGGYYQGYGYEDGPGQTYNNNQGGYGNRFQKRPQRRERDDKVHDSIIEERIQRERPCRTLFIRNIKYETNSDDVRRLFEEHGEIKTFFDLIANRGMVFVTYYDLRAAERARDRLQGSEISSRPIDVHYSLPRDDHGRGADRQKDQELQGHLVVTLRNSATNQMIDDNEVRHKFQQFGDVKSVRPVGDRPDQRYVEFYDTRACEEAHDRLRHQGLQDGVMEIDFASPSDDPRAASPRRDDRGDGTGGAGGLHHQREWDGVQNRGRRGGRGGRGRGRGFGGNDWEDRRDFRDRNSRSFEDEFGREQRPAEFNNNNNNNNNRGSHNGYGSPPPPGPGYGPPSGGYTQTSAAPPPAAADERERLEQAKKVQQLLAALKQPQGGPAPAGPPPPPPSAPTTAHPPQVPPPQSNVNSYYGQPPMPPAQVPSYVPAPPSAPPSNPYAPMPPQPSTSTPVQGGPATLAGLPPNILALLQQSGQAQPAQNGVPPMPPYSMPPASALMRHQQPPPSNPQPDYQQYMSYMNQKR
ncbi:hypothetical protein C8Q80DRAFT_1129098 [Daedaleopsis nitida]|nr:hypothetical protein C8Q80DRAFT_1129098 [Daedaleopsis nitida]